MPEPLLACRACLATDGNLYNVHKFKLVTKFEEFTGIKVKKTDKFPQHLCVLCQAFVEKFYKFRNRCWAAQDILEDAAIAKKTINKEYINNAKKKRKKIFSSLKIVCMNKVLEFSYDDNIIKEESSNEDLPPDIVKPEDTQGVEREDYLFNMDSNIFVNKMDYPQDVKIDDHKTPNDNIPMLNSDSHELTATKSLKSVEIENSDYSDNDDPRDEDFKIELEYDTDNKSTNKDFLEEMEKIITKKEIKKLKLTTKKVKKKRSENNKKASFESAAHIAEIEKNYNCKVNLLSKQEQIDKVNERKNSSNYMGSQYKCESCFRGFNTEETFKNHLLKHDPLSGSILCEVCRFRFKSMRAMYNHRMRHKLHIQCNVCKYISTNGYQAKDHFKFHNGFKYECKFCGKNFSKPTSHLSHVRIHHPSELISCDVCGETFIGHNGVACHKRISHHQSSSYCKQCNTQFSTTDALKVHSDMLDDCCENTFSCTVCGANFSEEAHLSNHVDVHRNEDNAQEYPCEVCKQTFANESSRTLHHRRVHLNIKVRQRFSRPKNKQGAARGHSKGTKRSAEDKLDNTKEKNYICEVCGKKYEQLGNLKIHQRVHTGEKPYECPCCAKKFAHSITLKCHLTIHTGERPYKCHLCPKAFTAKPNLKRHIKVHTGEKSFPCAVCGKFFSQSQAARLHVRTVHMKLPPPPRRRR